MFEHLTIRWIVVLLALGLIIYFFTLLFEDGRFILAPKPKQTYVTVQLDSTITKRQLTADKKAFSTPQLDLRTMVATMDSDSLKRYDLYRYQQEIVTIDLEDHTEPTRLTFKDIQTWFHAIGYTFEQLKNKKNNDNH